MISYASSYAAATCTQSAAHSPIATPDVQELAFTLKRPYRYGHHHGTSLSIHSSAIARWSIMWSSSATARSRENTLSHYFEFSDQINNSWILSSWLAYHAISLLFLCKSWHYDKISSFTLQSQRFAFFYPSCYLKIHVPLVDGPMCLVLQLKSADGTFFHAQVGMESPWWMFCRLFYIPTMHRIACPSTLSCFIHGLFA